MDYPSIHAPNGAIEQFAFLYALGFSLVDSHEQTDGLPTFHLVYEHADRAIRITVCQAWDRGIATELSTSTQRPIKIGGVTKTLASILAALEDHRVVWT